MEFKPNLRFEFVEMLFALAIGQVGIEVGDLVIHKINFWDHPYIFTHLLLGTLIIALSWIGWKSSVARGNTENVISIYSVQFAILLVDLFLVICYFIIVKGAEIPFNSNNKAEINLSTYNLNTSSQSYWTIVIFIFYLIWDFLTKFLNQGVPLKLENKFKKNRPYDLKGFISRAWQTSLCLILAMAVYKLMGKANNSLQACSVDLSLISIFFIFRSLKFKINKENKLERSQVPPSWLDDSVISGANFPITIQDDSMTYRIKIIVAKFLPFILLVSSFIVYFINKQ